MIEAGKTLTVGDRRYRVTGDLGLEGKGKSGSYGHVLAVQALLADGAIDPERLVIKTVNTINLDNLSRQISTHGAQKGLKEKFTNSLLREAHILRLVAEQPGAAAIPIIPYLHSGPMQFRDGGEAYPALVMPRADFTLADWASDAGEPGAPSFHPHPHSLRGTMLLLTDMVKALLFLLRLPGPPGMIYCHRDIKPSNILAFRGRWLLADFGTARMFRDQTGTIVGNRVYAAPELWQPMRQAEATGIAPNVAIDYRPVDIYSLAMSIISVLSGLPFHQGERRLPPSPGVQGTVLLDHEYQALQQVIATMPVDDGPSAGIETSATLIPVPASAPDPARLERMRSGLLALLTGMLAIKPAARPNLDGVQQQLHDLQLLLDPVPPSPKRATPWRHILRAVPQGASPSDKRIITPKTGKRGRRTAAIISFISVPLAALAIGIWLPMDNAIQHFPRPLASDIELQAVAPLTERALARWNGLPEAYPQPLCVAGGNRSVPVGDRVVANVKLVPAQAPTATLWPGRGDSQSGSCTPMDRNGTWQCTAATENIAPGPAEFQIQSPDGNHLRLPFHILTARSGCTGPVPPKPTLAGRQLG